ncbi:heme-binding protein 2-like [Impatiens glandulifera]|uniref:heme-binding protein 2-like n=1 Tax=Impatiens glandulifera TaxID=253017 RepID=UPI001FB10F64|nr:heme-binding protein 2-like [Impatiens glandulifera]XP_047316227.1 heme-binding protein 2-like [Impatiens glandulifera]
MANDRFPWKTLTVLLNLLCFTVLCVALESPQYSVIHKESDFEIRRYRDLVWMSAPVKEVSFHKATRNGFHRLFQFIEGANLNFSRIPMTVPILTSIVPDAGPLHSWAYYVRLYLPAKFQENPPLPLPELNLQPTPWSSRSIAVRQFSGFADDDNIVKEADKLATSLSRSPWSNSTSSASGDAYSIAQYNSPFRFIGRVNEVWVEVNEPVVDHSIFSGGIAS